MMTFEEQFMMEFNTFYCEESGDFDNEFDNPISSVQDFIEFDNGNLLGWLYLRNLKSLKSLDEYKQKVKEAIENNLPHPHENFTPMSNHNKVIKERILKELGL